MAQNVNKLELSEENVSGLPKRSGTRLLRLAAKYFIATVCSAAVGSALSLIIIATLSNTKLGQRDFVVYWATGQLLAHHSNPYDATAILKIEHSVGFPSDRSAMLMRNPPWALPLVYPLGFLGPQMASLIWSLLLIASLVYSVYLLWDLHGRTRSNRYLLGATFGPALFCLMNAQVAPFALLGLVLFLRLHRTRPFAAGAALWFCALKPHLFLPFGVVLLAWIVMNRSYKLATGAATAIGVSCWIAWLLDAHAWSHYAQMVRSSRFKSDIIPCTSYLLRSWINPKAMWIEFLPAAVSCVWALFYFWRRRQEWDWTKQGSLLLLVSILAAPYCWLFDQTLAIPALMEGIYRTRSREILAILAFTSALVEVALMCNIWRPAAIYLWTYWTAPTWLIWYLIAYGSSNELWRERYFRAKNRLKSLSPHQMEIDSAQRFND